MVFDQIELPIIEAEKEARQAFAHMQVGDVFAVVVIPHRGW